MKGAYWKNGGTMRWNATASCGMCKRDWLMTRQDNIQKKKKDLGRTLTDSVWIIGDYIPITAKDKSRIHQIGFKRATEVFLGFVL